jgi:hypothetical protein
VRKHPIGGAPPATTRLLGGQGVAPGAGPRRQRATGRPLGHGPGPRRPANVPQCPLQQPVRDVRTLPGGRPGPLRRSSRVHSPALLPRDEREASRSARSGRWAHSRSSRRSTGDPRSSPSSGEVASLVSAPSPAHVGRPCATSWCWREPGSDQRRAIFLCRCGRAEVVVSGSVRRRGAGGLRARRLVRASARAGRGRRGRAGPRRRSSSPAATVAASAAQPPSSGGPRGTTSAAGRLRAPGRRLRGVARLLAGSERRLTRAPGRA